MATGLAAALPVIVSTIRGLSAGWTPEGDQAVVATRAYDVFSSWTPLVGPWSSTSNDLGVTAYHPGPLLYWVLAIPARVPEVAVFPLVMCAINVAAVVGAVLLARRRGGRALMYLTAAALALMCASLSTEALRDIWAPTAPLLAFTLLFFVCWSLACGEYRMLPLAVLIASFATQAHFVFLLPCAALLGVGLVGLIASRPRAAPAPDFRRWVAAGAVVALLCWSGPLIDQVLGWAGSDRGTGNLVHLAEAADSRDDPAGAKAGVYAAARAVGVPPWWLRPPPEPIERVYDIFAKPAFPALASAAALLVLLAVATALGLRRRRRDVATAAALALGAVAALAIVTASFPNTPSQIFSYSYASWWAAPVGMWAWLIAAWSVATLWSLPATLRKLRPSGVPAMVPLCLVLVVAVLVSVGQDPNPEQQLYDATITAVREVDEELPEPGAVRVDASPIQLETAVIHALRRRGATIGADDISVQFGPDYARGDRRYERVVDIRHGTAPPDGARAIARVGVTAPRRARYVVSLRRAE